MSPKKVQFYSIKMSLWALKNVTKVIIVKAIRILSLAARQTGGCNTPTGIGKS